MGKKKQQIDMQFNMCDTSYKLLVEQVLRMGSWRDTRSGRVKSYFSPFEFNFDLRIGAPLLTGKTVAVQPMIGELLWFIDGAHSIHQLQEKTLGVASDKKTIWTPDQERWYNALPERQQNLLKYPDDLGRIYGRQWRNSAGKFGTEVDQFAKLVKLIKEQPESRYLIVNAWNAAEIDANMMALPPCHMMFQIYIEGDVMHLKWYQRSVDVFLGLPFNIASYGTLLAILAKMCGYKAGRLIGSFGDAHVYEQHQDAVAEYLQNYEDNKIFKASTIRVPEIDSLENLCKMTALDFKEMYPLYESAGVIKAPLSVG